MTYYLLIIALGACVFVLAYTPQNTRALQPRTRRQETAATTGTTLTSSHAALCLELMSTLLASGKSLLDSMSVLAGSREEFAPLGNVARALARGLTWDEAWAELPEHSGWALLAHELKFVHRSAAPTADMLIAAADQIRSDESQRIKERSQEISSKLVLPTGLLSLPAFICWGILPAVLALLGQVELF